MRSARLLAIAAALMLAALIAGGFGSYLIRGGASSVSTARTTSVSAPALSGHFTEPHDDNSGAAAAGLTEPRDVSAAVPTASGLTEPHVAIRTGRAIVLPIMLLFVGCRE